MDYLPKDWVGQLHSEQTLGNDWTSEMSAHNAKYFEKDRRALSDFRHYLKTTAFMQGDVDAMSDEDVVKGVVDSLRKRDGNTVGAITDYFQTKNLAGEDLAVRQRIQKWFQARPDMFSQGGDLGAGLMSYGVAALTDPLNVFSFGSGSAAAKASLTAAQQAARQAGASIADHALSRGLTTGALAGAKYAAGESFVTGAISDYILQNRDVNLGVRDGTSVAEALGSGAIGAAIGAPIGGVLGGIGGARVAKEAVQAGDNAYAKQVGEEAARAAAAAQQQAVDAPMVKFQQTLDSTPVEGRDAVNSGIASAIQDLQLRRSKLVDQLTGAPLNAADKAEVDALDHTIARIRNFQNIPEVITARAEQARAKLEAGDKAGADAITLEAERLAEGYRMLLKHAADPTDVQGISARITGEANDTVNRLIAQMKAAEAAASKLNPAAAATPNATAAAPVQPAQPAQPAAQAAPAAPAAGMPNVEVPAANTEAATPAVGPATAPTVAPVVAETPTTGNGHDLFAEEISSAPSAKVDAAPQAPIEDAMQLANSIIPMGGVTPDGKPAAAAPATPTAPAATAVQGAPADMNAGGVQVNAAQATPATPVAPNTTPPQTGLGGRIAEMERQLADIRLLTEQLSAIKKGSRTPEQEAALKAAKQKQGAVQRQINKAKKEAAATEATEGATPADAAGTTAPQAATATQTPAAFAQRLANGEKPTSLEDQQFYINNAQAIEDELAKIKSAADAQAAAPKPPEAPQTTEAAVAEIASTQPRIEGVFDPATVGGTETGTIDAIKALGFAESSARRFLDDARKAMPEGTDFEVAALAHESARLESAAILDAQMMYDAQGSYAAAFENAKSVANPQQRARVQAAIEDMARADFAEHPEFVAELKTYLGQPGGEELARSIWSDVYPPKVLDDFFAATRGGESLKQDLSFVGIDADVGVAIRTQTALYEKRLGSTYLDAETRSVLRDAYARGLITEAKKAAKRGEKYVVPQALSKDDMVKFVAQPVAPDFIKQMITSVVGVIEKMDPKLKEDPNTYVNIAHGLLSAGDPVTVRALLRPGLNVDNYLRYLVGSGTFIEQPTGLLARALADAGRVDSLGIGRQVDVQNRNKSGALQSIVRKGNTHGFFGRLDFKGTFSSEDQAISRARFAILNALLANGNDGMKLTGALRQKPVQKSFSLSKLKETVASVNDPNLNSLYDMLEEAITTGSVNPEVVKQAAKRLSETTKALREPLLASLNVGMEGAEKGEIRIAKEALLAELERVAGDFAGKDAAAVQAELKAFNEARAATDKELAALERRHAKTVAAIKEQEAVFAKKQAEIQQQIDAMAEPVGMEVLKGNNEILRDKLREIDTLNADLAKAKDAAVKERLTARLAAVQQEVATRRAQSASIEQQNNAAIARYKERKAELQRQLEQSKQLAADSIPKLPPELLAARTARQEAWSSETPSLVNKTQAEVERLAQALRLNQNQFNTYSRHVQATKEITSQLRTLARLGEQTGDGRTIDFSVNGEDKTLTFFEDPYTKTAFQALPMAQAQTDMALHVYRSAELLDMAIADLLANGTVQPATLGTDAGRALLRTIQNSAVTPDSVSLTARTVNLVNGGGAIKAPHLRAMDAKYGGILARYGLPVVRKAGERGGNAIAAAAADEIKLAKEVALNILHGAVHHDVLNEQYMRIMAKGASGVPNTVIMKELAALAEKASTPPSAPVGTARGVEIDLAKDISWSAQPDGTKMVRYKGVDVAVSYLGDDGKKYFRDIATGQSYEHTPEALVHISTKQAHAAASAGLANRSGSSLLQDVTMMYQNGLYKGSVDSTLIAPDSPLTLHRTYKELGIPESHRLAYRYNQNVYRASDRQTVRDMLPSTLRGLSDEELLKQVEVGLLPATVSESSGARFMMFSRLDELYKNDGVPTRNTPNQRLRMAQPITKHLSLEQAAGRRITEADVGHLPAEVGSKYLHRTALDLHKEALNLELIDIGKVALNDQVAELDRISAAAIEINSVLAKVAPNGVNLSVQSRHAAQQELMALLSRSDAADVANAITLLHGIKSDAAPMFGSNVASPTQGGEFQLGNMAEKTPARILLNRAYVGNVTDASGKIVPDSGRLPRSLTIAHEMAHWAYFNLLSPQDRIDWWKYVRARSFSGDGGIDQTFLGLFTNPLRGLNGADISKNLHPQEVFANLFTRWLGEEKAFVGGGSMWTKVANVISSVIRFFTGKSFSGSSLIDDEAAGIFERFFDATDGFTSHSPFAKWRQQLVGTISPDDAGANALLREFDAVQTQRVRIAEALSNADPMAMFEAMFEAGDSPNTGIMRWTYGSLMKSPSKASGLRSVFHGTLSMFKSEARVNENLKSVAGPNLQALDSLPATETAREYLTSKSSVYDMVKTLNEDMYQFFKGEATKAGVDTSTWDDAGMKVMEASSEDYANMWEATVAHLQANAPDNDAIRTLGIRVLAGLDKLGKHVGEEVMRRAQEPMRLLFNQLDVDTTGKPLNKQKQIILKRAAEAADNYERVLAEANAAIDTVRAAHPNHELTIGSTAFDSSVHKMSPAALVAVYRAANGEGTAARMAAFEAGRRMMAAPQKITIDGKRLAELKSKYGPKQAAMALMQSLDEGNRNAVTEYAALLSHYGEAGKPLLPLKQDMVIDAVVDEIRLGDGQTNYVGVPAGASAHVAEVLVAMTHRDPQAQYTLRTMTTRMLNLLSKTAGKALNETTVMTGDAIDRLLGNGGGVGRMLDLRGPEFGELRKKMRSFAIQLSSEDKAPSMTLMHEIGHVLRRSVMTAEDDSRMVAAYLKAAGHGDDMAFKAMTSTMNPDPAVLRAAEEWFVEGFADYLHERVAKGDFTNGSGELRGWLSSKIDLMREGMAYVTNGLIGNKTIRQDYRQLLFFGDVFDTSSERNIQLITRAGKTGDGSIGAHEFSGFARDYEAVSPRAAVEVARAFGGVPSADALSEHIYAAYRFEDGVTRLYSTKDARGMTAKVSKEMDERLEKAGITGPDRELASYIRQQIDSKRFALANDENMTTAKADKLRLEIEGLRKEASARFGRHNIAMDVSPVMVRAKNPIVFTSRGAFDKAVEDAGGLPTVARRAREVGAFDSIRINDVDEFGRPYQELIMLNSDDMLPLAYIEARVADDAEAIAVMNSDNQHAHNLSALAVASSLDGSLRQNLGTFASAGAEGGITQSMMASLKRIARREPTKDDIETVRKHSGLLQLSTNSHILRKMGAGWFADFVRPVAGANYFERHNAEMAKRVMPLLDKLQALPDHGNRIKRWARSVGPLFAPPKVIRKYIPDFIPTPDPTVAVPESYKRVHAALIARDTKGLTKQEADAANSIADYFKDTLKRMQDAGVVVGDATRYMIGYIPQVWSKDLLETNGVEFRNALAKWMLRDRARYGVRSTMEDVLASAEKVVKKLTAEDGVALPDFQHVGVGSDETMRRVLAIPYSEMMEFGLDNFLVKDLDSLVAHYAETAERRIAMTKHFGVDNHGFNTYHAIAAGGAQAAMDTLMTGKTAASSYYQHTDGRALYIARDIMRPLAEDEGQAAAIMEQVREIFSRYDNPHDAKFEAKRYLESLYTHEPTAGEFAKRVDAIVNGLADFGLSGGRVSNADSKFMGQFFSRLENKPTSNDYNYQASVRFAQGLKGFNSMALLGFTMLSSLPDVALPGVVSGRMSSFLKGWHDFISKDIAGEEYRRAVRSCGVAMENMAHELMTNLHGSGGSKRSNAFFHLNGLNGWTKTMRTAASFVAMSSFKTEQGIAQRLEIEGKTQSRAYARAMNHLKKYGLEKYGKVGAPALENLTMETLQDEIRQAVHRFVNEAIFAPNKDDIPLSAQGPWGSLMFQLKSYPLMMGRLMGDVLMQAKEGNFGPLSMIAAVGLPMAGASLALKDYAMARGGNDERQRELRDRSMKAFSTGNKDADLALGWASESFLAFGGLGLVADLFYNAADKVDNGAWGAIRIMGAIMGPSVQTVGMTTFDAAAGVKEMITDPDSNTKQRAAVRSLLNVTPFVGGSRGIREGIVDAVAGQTENRGGPFGASPFGSNPFGK